METLTGQLPLFLMSEARVPSRLRTAETSITVLNPSVKLLKYSGVIVTTVPENIPTVSDLGMYDEMISVAMTMLNSCPRKRMVPRKPEAMPELSR